MKILYVVQSVANEADGVAVFVKGLAAALRAAGHEVDVLTREGSSSAVDFGAYDIIHFNALWSLWQHKIAKRVYACRRSGGSGRPRVVWSPHGMLTKWALKHKWYKKLPGLLLFQYRDLARADLLHATAPSEVEDIRRLHLANPVETAPLGVDLAAASPRHASAAPGKTLLFVSRIHRKKGLPMLLKAWSRLPKALRRDWRLKIAGPDQEGYTEDLKRQKAALEVELEEKFEVQFIGPVYGEEKCALYESADLFVLPTHSENFGAVVLEALAHSLPVICTKGAPWAELVDERCGWWCDISVEGLEASLREAMALSDEARRRMGSGGRRLVERKYTWPAVAKTLAAAYAGM